MPQVGNVLVGFTGILEEGGFGGRVTNYSLEQSFYVPVYAKANKDTVIIPAAGGSSDVKVSTNGVVR